MSGTNDNFPNENALLLVQAKEILKCDNHEKKESPCALITGGYCPLLTSAMASFKKLSEVG